MTRVLLPVAVLEGETVSSGLMSLLAPVDVTVLGYHVVPEQTPPDQAREQFEERAVSALDDIAQEFEAVGGAIETRLVFTNDRDKTVDRVADDTGSQVYAINGATGDPDSLLVPLTGDVAVERVLSFVSELVAGRDIAVTLFLASEADGATELLEESASRLRADGVAVGTELAVSGQPLEALIDEVPGHDAIVVGEAAPSLTEFLLGDEAERLAAASVGPVLVVRNVADRDEMDRDEMDRDVPGHDDPDRDGRDRGA